MKKYLLVFSIALYAPFAFSGTGITNSRQEEIKRFTGGVANLPHSEFRIKAFTNFITAGTQQANKTDALAQRIIGYRINADVGGPWQLIDSANITYSGNRGSVMTSNELYDIKNDFKYDGGVANEYHTTRTWDVNGNNTEMTLEIWNAGAFENSDRDINTFDANGNRLTNTHQRWNAGAWENYSRTANTWDASNRLLVTTLYKWASGAWVEDDRYLNTWDANGNKLTDQIQDWVSGAWLITTSTVLTYNGSNKMLTRVQQTDNGGALQNNSRTTYTYDGNGDNTVQVVESWVSGAWENSQRDTYTYDANHNITLGSNESWYLGAWLNTTRDAYTWNANNKNLTLTRYRWVSGAWEGDYRNIYTYNLNNRLTESLFQTWVTGAWENYNRYIYTYDANGYADVFTQQNWIAGAWENVSLSDFEVNATHGNMDYEMDKVWNGSTWLYNMEYYWYYESYNAPSGIETTAGAIRFNAYPNPASSLLNIDFNTPVYGETTLRVYNITGGLVASTKQLSAIGDNYQQLDIAALGSGIYFVEMQQGEHTGRAKFTKQ